MSDKNIYQRIHAAMMKVAYVQKDTSVGFGNSAYRAVTHDMVLAVLRPEMLAQGIVTRVEQTGSEILHLRGANPKDDKSQYGQTLYAADFNVHFVNIDDPQDFMTVSVSAHGMDTMDKAPGKATSMAVKYAMLKTFGLETGENEEGRLAEKALFTEIQKDEFDRLMEEQDALGFLCFTKSMGDDAFNALQRTFPDGKISQNKKLANSLVTDGFKVLKEAAVQVERHCNNHDTDGLLEILREFKHPVEKQLLAGLLTPDQIKALKDVSKL